MKPKILIHIGGLKIGGAERALLGLLSAIDPSKVKVDLFLNKHYGEFFDLIPEFVNILPEIPAYQALEGNTKDALRSKQWQIAILRQLGKYQHSRYIKRKALDVEDKYNSLFQYIADAVDPCLPSLKFLGEYDLAISFLTPHNIVLHKVKAKKKICWIHTDYGTINIDVEKELKIWGGYDYIVAISDDCRRGFLKKFPGLASKLIDIENILSPTFIRSQAKLEDVSAEMPGIEGCINILTAGRFSPPKKIEGIPHIASELVKLGIKFRWYIVGFGDDRLIQEALDIYNMREYVILLGKKTNPYPYIAACDIYAQPSRFEGKSVAVREAQILQKPVVVTNFPTASSQIRDGVDGVIVPMEEIETARAMAEFLRDKEKQHHIKLHLAQSDYGNESGVETLYRLI